MDEKIREIFEFVNSNSNLVTSSGGNTSIVTGLDKYKLFSLAKMSGIDLEPYGFFVEEYQRRMLNLQDEYLKKK